MVTVADYLANRDSYLDCFTDEHRTSVCEHMAQLIQDLSEQRRRSQVRQMEAYAANVGMQMTI